VTGTLKVTIIRQSHKLIRQVIDNKTRVRSKGCLKSIAVSSVMSHKPTVSVYFGASFDILTL